MRLGGEEKLEGDVGWRRRIGDKRVRFVVRSFLRA
jgi:hypothetical protein